MTFVGPQHPMFNIIKAVHKTANVVASDAPEARHLQFYHRYSMLVDCMWKVPKSHKLCIPWSDQTWDSWICLYRTEQRMFRSKRQDRRPTHLLRSCESPLDGRLVDHPMQSQAVVNVEEERFPLKTNKCCILHRLSDSGHSSPSTEVKLHLVFNKQRWIMVDQKASCLHVVLELDETPEWIRWLEIPKSFKIVILWLLPEG